MTVPSWKDAVATEFAGDLSGFSSASKSKRGGKRPERKDSEKKKPRQPALDDDNDAEMTAADQPAKKAYNNALPQIIGARRLSSSSLLTIPMVARVVDYFATEDDETFFKELDARLPLNEQMNRKQPEKKQAA